MTFKHWTILLNTKVRKQLSVCSSAHTPAMCVFMVFFSQCLRKARWTSRFIHCVPFQTITDIFAINKLTSSSIRLPPVMATLILRTTNHLKIIFDLH